MLAPRRLLRGPTQQPAHGILRASANRRDALAHGVEVRPVCINASRWDCTLASTENEDRFADRLGLRMVKGLANAHAAAIVACRADRPFASVDDLWRRAGVPVAALTQIAEADGFRASFALARREALWTIKALRDEPLVVWPQVFEANRRTVLSAGMIAVRGRIQREGEVVHLVAQRFTDISAELASVGERGAPFPVPHGRGDQVTHAGGPDRRELPPKGLRIRDIYIPDLHIDTIRVKTRDFH